MLTDSPKYGSQPMERGRPADQPEELIIRYVCGEAIDLQRLQDAVRTLYSRSPETLRALLGEAFWARNAEVLDREWE